MKNHLGTYECKLCLTLHNTEVFLCTVTYTCDYMFKLNNEYDKLHIVHVCSMHSSQLGLVAWSEIQNIPQNFRYKSVKILPYALKITWVKCFANNTCLAFRGESFAIPKCREVKKNLPKSYRGSQKNGVVV